MAHHKFASLRTHRKKSGLSQREVAMLLGYVTEGEVIRHEYGTNMPPLLMALAYAVLYQAPVSDLFPGFSRTVEQGVENRLAELERTLQNKSAKGRNARAIAHKLEWMCARRMGIEI